MRFDGLTAKAILHPHPDLTYDTPKVQESLERQNKTCKLCTMAASIVSKFRSTLHAKTWLASPCMSLTISYLWDFHNFGPLSFEHDPHHVIIEYFE